MSGKKNDILISLESHIDKESRKNVSKLISLLEGQIPRIGIDREYQKSLRESLILPKKQKIPLKITFPWLAFVSSIGVVSTCFIAAFGLYNIWIESWGLESPIVSLMSWSDMMYSEEKAERFSGVASLADNTGESTRWVSPVPKGLAQIHPTTFKVEKASIDSEISDIKNDIMDTDAFIPSTNTSPPKSLQMMRSLSREDTPLVSVNPTQPSDMREPIMKISPSLALSQSLKSKPDVTYPSIMKIYMKSTLWIESEISNRSWSGVIEWEVSTEKRSVIENKYVSLAAWRMSKSSTLIYLPMTKISRDPTDLYYLIPALEYTLEWWEKIMLPLIRGYR